MLPVLAVAALAVLPPSAPPTDLPPGADPCIALTPAVVDELRTSGALTGLVPGGLPTATLITVGRSLTGCPSTGDPDPATVKRQVCPLLTAEGVGTLADRFGASPAVRADLGPERITIARNALQCDHPAATAPDPTAAEPAGDSDNNTVDRADRGLPRHQGLAIIPLTAAAVALLGVLLLMVVLMPPVRRSDRGGGAAGQPQVLHPPPGSSGSGRRRSTDDRDHDEDQRRATPGDDADTRVGPEDRSESYDELLEGLRREVEQLRRTDEASRERSTKPDTHREH